MIAVKPANKVPAEDLMERCKIDSTEDGAWYIDDDGVEHVVDFDCVSSIFSPETLDINDIIDGLLDSYPFDNPSRYA